MIIKLAKSREKFVDMSGVFLVAYKTCIWMETEKKAKKSNFYSYSRQVCIHYLATLALFPSNK